MLLIANSASVARACALSEGDQLAEPDEDFNAMPRITALLAHLSNIAWIAGREGDAESLLGQIRSELEFAHMLGIRHQESRVDQIEIERRKAAA